MHPSRIPITIATAILDPRIDCDAFVPLRPTGPAIVHRLGSVGILACPNLSNTENDVEASLNVSEDRDFGGNAKP